MDEDTHGKIPQRHDGGTEMIANSGHDENGKYRGGKAGDQTGTEWAVIPFYSRPWSCILRYPDKKVAADMAYLAQRGADNPMVGYDQGERASFAIVLFETPHFDPGEIAVPCESDCTCGVATIVKAAGKRAGIVKLASIDPDYYYSGNIKTGFAALGFRVLTDPKYLTSDRYLLPGDILLLENHHAAINLSVGDMVRDEWDDTPTYTIGWNRNDFGWWYADTAHTYIKEDWRLINHHWYYFNLAGYAVTGLQTIGGNLYYFNAVPSDPYECALMCTNESGALIVWDVD